MGNPRQHRKARSSAHKVVKHSRHAKRNLRKMKPIRGPKVLQDAWDKKKTLRQNYAAMGLMESLRQLDSGGSERPAAPERASKEKTSGGATSLPRGFGKIIRNAEGGVVGVELPEENAGEDIEDEPADVDTEPKTELVNQLQKLAQTPRPKPRFSSNGEFALLKKLVAKHGQDLEAMAIDRRMNPWQRTAGQLQRAMKKAGLI